MLDTRVARALWLGAAAAAAAVATTTAAADADRPIRGQVIDAASGRAVAGATVAAGASATATTDADGRFVLPAGAAGRVDVFVYADGYLPATVTVGDGRAVRVALSTTAAAGEVIEVSGHAPDDGAPGGYELEREEIRVLPGAGNDILKAAQSLPGAARIPFGLGGMVLRGTDPRDTNIYLDGIEVPIAFHVGAVASFFPSTLLESMTVVPGGIGAGWGRALGGMVELRSRPARGDRWRVGSEVSLLDASAYAEGPAAGGAVALGLRRSYVDAVLGAVMTPEDRFLPRYYDGQLRWERGTAPTGQLTALVFFSDDHIVRADDVFTGQFARGALRYRRRLGATELSLLQWAGWNTIAFDTLDYAPLSRLLVRRTTVPAGLRAELRRDAAWGHVAGGVDAEGGRVGQLWVHREGADAVPGVARWYGNAALWAEAHARLAGDRIAITPGLRGEHYGLSDEGVIDPRLRVSHRLHPDFAVHESLGLYHQPPTAAELEPRYGNPALRSSRAIHAAIGAELALPGADVAVTAFHIAVDRLPVSTHQSDPPRSGMGAVLDLLLEEHMGALPYQENLGRGRSDGLELSVKHGGPRWIGWIAYTLSRAERTQNPASVIGWYPRPLDQRHNLTAVASTRLGRWRFGARLRWVTGVPYTPVVDWVVGRGGEMFPVFGGRSSARLPDFVQLDLRVDRAWRRRWGAVEVFLDVQNASNADNAEDMEIRDDRQQPVRGLPILPAFGVIYAPPP